MSLKRLSLVLGCNPGLIKAPFTTNRHNDKCWNRTGIVVASKGFGQSQVKLDGSGRLSLCARAHLKPFNSYPGSGTSAPPLLSPRRLQSDQGDGEEFHSAPSSPKRSATPSSSLGSDSPPSDLTPSDRDPLDFQPFSGCNLETLCSPPDSHSNPTSPSATKKCKVEESTLPQGRPPGTGCGLSDPAPAAQNPDSPRRSKRAKPIIKYSA